MKTVEQAYQVLSTKTPELQAVYSFVERNASRVATFPRTALWDDLKLLAFGGTVNSTEYGSTVGVMRRQGFLIVNKPITPGMAVEQPPLTSDQARAAKVMFHVHYLTSTEQTSVGTNISATVTLPSFIPPAGLNPNGSGDIAIQHLENIDIGDLGHGGAVNVISQYGVTLNISAIRNIRQSPEWKVTNGIRAGNTFVRTISPTGTHESIGDERYDDVLVLVHSDGINYERTFLFLSWKQVEVLAQQGITLEDVCFGTGLQKLKVTMPELRGRFVETNLLNVIDNQTDPGVLNTRLNARI